MDFPIGSMGAAIFGALAVLAWRMHESRRPVSLRGLVIPPLGMSTGFSMFAMQAFRVPWMWGLSAFVLGAAIFAQPVIASSRLTREGNVVMMRRSPWFIVIILVLAAIRLALRGQIDHPPRIPRLLPFADEELASIDRPVCVLVGAHTEVFDVDEVVGRARLIPAATVATVPDGGHAFPVDHVDLVVSYVEAMTATT